MSQITQRSTRLPELTTGRLRQMLSDGLSPTIQFSLEVLELGPSGGALVWVWDGDKGQSRMDSCRLSPENWAEALLCIDRGLRPVFRFTWHVLAESEDGLFCLVSDPHHPMTAYPASAYGRVEQMLGIDESAPSSSLAS
jgi:hypothetical protein